MMTPLLPFGGGAGEMMEGFLEGTPLGFQVKADDSKMPDSKKSLLSWNFPSHRVPTRTKHSLNSYLRFKINGVKKVQIPSQSCWSYCCRPPGPPPVVAARKEEEGELT
ncbi:hypothetical protein ATANTOWER_006153 [Ataeniobius toweri]|uniref:Uncharacterized protein n=1 Tax=Ataeniobius toweri TaxID=208326 RepID=A0ABU7CF08_9TELE|nr:hypothetical protein [Ataeniobius toweri]